MDDRHLVGGQDLQGHFSIQTGVLCEIDLTHATRTEEQANLITTKLCFGSKGHEETEPRISRIRGSHNPH